MPQVTAQSPVMVSDRDRKGQFCLDETCFTCARIKSAWPGQALSYKMGQRKILELRERAQKELGPKFDLRAFHDAVLDQGPLPLDVLETKINDWITKNK